MPMKLPNWISNFGKTEDPDLTEESFLSGWRIWAFRILAVLIVAATAVGLTESFDGLYIWFSTHGVTGIWADFAPLAIDTFSVIGELAIFTALTGHWHWKKRLVPWGSVLLGFGASVGGNVGRVAASHPLTWDLTALVFPVSGAFGILIGFSVLKSLAKEKADLALQKRLMMKAEIIAPDLMTGTEGLKELEEVASQEKTPGIEAPKLKGLDALIPPREAQMPPATVPVSEDGANTLTEWRGLPEGAQRLRRADLQTTVRNTGQFPVVQ